jgi:CDP-glycerol glycerophosphotransferase (TagB/SpsB family)
MNNCVFISAPYGLQIHDLLESDILSFLVDNRRTKIIVLTLPQKKQLLEEMLGNLDGQVEVKDLYLNAMRYRKHIIGWIHKIRNTKWVLKSKLLTLASEYFVSSFYTEKQYRKYFQTYHPSIVITSTPGLNPIDRFLLKEAKKAKIRTLSIVESWDKLLTKGPMYVRPDFLAVWSKIMKEEAINIHHYTQQNVFVVGTTRFDAYLKDRENILPRNQYLKKLKLDQNKKLITLTTAPARAVGDHLFILEILIEAVKENKFKKPVQIVCRLHPNDDYHRYKDFMNTSHILFDIPNYDLNAKNWTPSHEDFIHLANLVKHTDVLINIASTMTIEAAIADTPIVNLGFSSSEPEHFETKIGEHHRKHYRHILDRNGVRIASNEEELISCINRYLSDPTLDRNGRRAIAEDLTHCLDGKTSERIAELISQITDLTRSK